MTASRSIGLILSTTFLITVASTLPSWAQSDEPDTVVQQLLRPFDSTDAGIAARQFIIDRLERGSTRWIPEVIEYADMRHGSDWLRGGERLLIYLLLEDARLQTLEPVRGLLRENSTFRSGRKDHELSELTHVALKRNERSLLRFLGSRRFDEIQAEFILLLYQSLTLQSVRTVDDLNERIDDFVLRYGTDERADLANRYLRRRLEASPIGIGLVVGYDAGRFTGPDSGSVAAHGPRFGIIGQINRISIELSGLVRSVDLHDGISSTTEGSIRLGYDIPPGSLLFLPFAGLHYWSIGEGESTLLTPLAGLDLGTDILFDDPPHLRLSIGGEWHLPSLYGESMISESHFWSLRFSLSLANRSYSIR